MLMHAYFIRSCTCLSLAKHHGHNTHQPQPLLIWTHLKCLHDAFQNILFACLFAIFAALLLLCPSSVYQMLDVAVQTPYFRLVLQLRHRGDITSPRLQHSEVILGHYRKVQLRKHLYTHATMMRAMTLITSCMPAAAC